MTEIITWIKALVVVTTISITMAHPTSEEPARNGKDVSPVMQSLLTDIARELISRSTSSNQVLTLNFANMLILLVLKGLLWGASYAGTAAGYPKGRSEDEAPEPLITETEILLLLSYLMGDEENHFDCLHRIACEDPFKAREYMNAGHIVMNAAKFIGLNNGSDQKYLKMLNQLQEVIKYKENGGICERRYSCNQNENENTI